MMNVGTQTNSLVNHLYSRMVNGQPSPVVGMGATILSWTDRDAGTIVEVEAIKNGYRVGVTRDHSKVVSGSTQDGSAEYEYSQNAGGYISRWQTDKNGMWVECHFNSETNRWKASKGNGLRIGARETYRDPSF